jgi:TRAP-type mannitol/chloroaromatic compound transport system substrate-binding protein
MKDDHFYSIDKLVEFGLNMGMANQMINMMNDSIRNMAVPGAEIRPQPQAMFYAIINEMQAGPFAESEVAQLISQKRITTETYMWRPGMAEWKKVAEMPEILRIVALTPPEFKKQ